MNDLMTYETMLKQTNGQIRHLLLGNGFSIGCDDRYQYRAFRSAVGSVAADRPRSSIRR